MLTYWMQSKDRTTDGAFQERVLCGRDELPTVRTFNTHKNFYKAQKRRKSIISLFKCCLPTVSGSVPDITVNNRTQTLRPLVRCGITRLGHHPWEYRAVSGHVGLLYSFPGLSHESRAALKNSRPSGSPVRHVTRLTHRHGDVSALLRPHTELQPEFIPTVSPHVTLQ